MKLKNKFLLKLLIFISIFIILIILNFLDFTNIIENKTIDLRFHLRGERKPKDNIVIIGIDDESLMEIGNWPWSRSIHAKLLDILREYNPKLIIFDIIFDVPSKDDLLLANKIKEIKKVILVNYLSSNTDPKLNIIIFQLRESTPILKESALYNGCSNLILDKDGVVRRHKLYFEDLSRNRYYSLSLYVYSYLNKISLENALLKFPHSFYINYLGGPSNIKIISYINVLNKEIDPSILKDKIIFIGSVSELLKDSLPTPYTGYKRWGKISLSNTSGVEIHANILFNMLNNDYLKEIPSWGNTLFIFIIITILGLLRIKRVLFNLILFFILSIVYFIINLYFFKIGIILPFTLPILSIFLGSLGNVIYQGMLPKEALEGLVIKKRYKLIKKLGSGGMATVYLAKDLNSKIDVAVKILHSQYSEDKEVVERFLREAKASTILDHPNIVRVLDHGKEDEYNFIVMEYVPGKDLKKIIEEKGPLPPLYAKQIILEVAKALDHAYSKNIVHRDIKPQNIRITPTGKLKLMDFGIAHLGSLSTLTQTGVFMGTPQYASPEQAEGSKVDIRSDIYSLGVVFFELLTGYLPYSEDTTISVMFKKLHEELPDPRTIIKDIPEGLALIIQKMTARFPEDRYQTPKELIEDLERGYPLKPYVKKKITSQETIIKKQIDEKQS
jgi:serine/threonine-protein kinase